MFKAGFIHSSASGQSHPSLETLPPSSNLPDPSLFLSQSLRIHGVKYISLYLTGLLEKRSDHTNLGGFLLSSTPGCIDWELEEQWLVTSKCLPEVQLAWSSSLLLRSDANANLGHVNHSEVGIKQKLVSFKAIWPLNLASFDPAQTFLPPSPYPSASLVAPWGITNLFPYWSPCEVCEKRM